MAVPSQQALSVSSPEEQKLEMQAARLQEGEKMRAYVAGEYHSRCLAALPAHEPDCSMAVPNLDLEGHSCFNCAGTFHCFACCLPVTWRGLRRQARQGV